MSTVTEIEDHAAHRATIEALFLQQPLVDVESAILRAITPHYQQRISEIRRLSKLTIENRPRSVVIGGRKKRLDGAYRFRPDGPALGPSADVERPAVWQTEHPAPFAPPFELTAPESKI